jgi:hypothetical protein
MHHEGDCFKVKEMVIKEPTTTRPGDVDPQAAIQALKVKAKVGRRARARRDAAMLVQLDEEGKFRHTQSEFVNEMEIKTETGDSTKDEQVRHPPPPPRPQHLIFYIIYAWY